MTTRASIVRVYEHDFKTCSHADDPIPQPLLRIAVSEREAEAGGAVVRVFEWVLQLVTRAKTQLSGACDISNGSSCPSP